MSKEDDKEPHSDANLLEWAKATQRTIEFVVNRQAQFVSDMQSLQEAQRHYEERWGRAEQRWGRTEEGIRTLLTIAEIHERGIIELREAQSRTQAQMAETDERLNALINTVEQYISERRNGGRQEP